MTREGIVDHSGMFYALARSVYNNNFHVHIYQEALNCLSLGAKDRADGIMVYWYSWTRAKYYGILTLLAPYQHG